MFLANIISDIDECANNPCLGGVCNDHINNYTCICNPGKTGKHCEFGKFWLIEFEIIAESLRMKKINSDST